MTYHKNTAKDISEKKAQQWTYHKKQSKGHSIKNTAKDISLKTQQKTYHKKTYQRT